MPVMELLTSHTHSPACEMGSNTGIQNRYNLARKLAQHLRAATLQTYDTERGAVAKQVLEADRPTTTLEFLAAKNRYIISSLASAD
ncbi:hypothetical protein BDV12DRAFT_204538 [Aspergillus spectabilis]